MFKIFVTTLLISFSPICFGDVSAVEGSPLEANVMLGSYHWTNTEKSQNDTYGVNVLYGNADFYLYKNSFGDLTFASGYKHTWPMSSWISVGLTLGVVYGYGLNDKYEYEDADFESTDRRFLPFILPSVTFHLSNFLVSTQLFASGASFSVGYAF